MENLVSLSELRSHYSGKRVFVTGHTGFKGAWLSACLHLLGAKVKGYALPPVSDGDLFNLLRLSLPSQESVLADIRDRERLKREIDSFQPDFIFHLAAQPLVLRSYEIPAETFEVNVAGTANLLESVRDLRKPCAVVIITTDKVYENRETGILYREDDMLGGYDPYSASKACTELVVASFRSSFFKAPGGPDQPGVISVASARAGNVIGGGDWNKDRIIPDIIRALQRREPVSVRNPSSVRPWQHVLEPLGGYLVLGALLYKQPASYSKAYNFGPLPEDHITVRELVETAIRVYGEGEWIDISAGRRPHEAGLLKLDITRAARELQWFPRLTARQAIEWTLEWYRHAGDQGSGSVSAAEYTFEQIKDYFSL